MSEALIQNFFDKITTNIDFDEYLFRISKLKNCIIIVAVKDITGNHFNNLHFDLMKRLGFKENLASKGWHGYIGISNSNKVAFESLAPLNSCVNYTGMIQGVEIKAESRPLNSGNLAEIFINGIDYAINERGLNFVVYDKDKNKVISSVCFDTHHSQIPVFLHRKKDVIVERRNLLNLSRFIDNYKPKIKIRIVTEPAKAFLPVIKSVYSIFNADNKYDVIIISMYNDNGGLFNKYMFNYVKISEYDIKLDQPDIVISIYADFIWKYGDEKKFIENSKLTFSIPMMLIPGIEIPFTEKWFVPPKNVIGICEKIVYKEVEKRGFSTEDIYQIGNPKFDTVYESMKKPKKLPPNWVKIDKKKVFLWTTDHHALQNNVTFDLYISSFLNYFKKNADDCALIIRPHPAYVYELIKEGIWTKAEYNAFKEFCENSENIIWDELDDYSLSYSLADCIFTDVNCGIALSAIPVDKPICILLRYDRLVSDIRYPELISHHSIVKNSEELLTFFETIRRGEDPMREKRHEAMEKFISHCDGKNGQRIKEFIEEKYLEKLAGNKQQDDMPHD